MPNGCVYSDTYFTSGINGISTRASGLCGRRIGPLHPQSTRAAAKNRNPLMAESFVVRRVTGAVPRRCCSVAPQFVVHGAARHTRLFLLGNAVVRAENDNTPAARRAIQAG